MQTNTVSYHKLQELKTELDTWRSQQSSRKQLPQHLWGKAFQLLDSLPIGTVSRELRLEYKKLKKHLFSSNNSHVVKI